MIDGEQHYIGTYANEEDAAIDHARAIFKYNKRECRSLFLDLGPLPDPKEMEERHCKESPSLCNDVGSGQRKGETPVERDEPSCLREVTYDMIPRMGQRYRLEPRSRYCRCTLWCSLQQQKSGTLSVTQLRMVIKITGSHQSTKYERMKSSFNSLT